MFSWKGQIPAEFQMEHTQTHSRQSFGWMRHIPDIDLDRWGQFQTDFWIDGAHFRPSLGWMGHIPDSVLDEWGTFQPEFWMDGSHSRQSF